MDQSSHYMAVISGQQRSMCATLERVALGGLSWAYGRIIGVRNAYYDTWSLPAWLDVPVISVGNLTVGGTGKTPMTLWVCERLIERGRKPAVLSRGYKASAEGLADELLMISQRCPQSVAVANPNREHAGRLAIEQYGVTAAVLDDGFQHRRLGRDLDLLLIDATRPFGFGHILPRGLLRESITSVRRADGIVLTRCDQTTAADIETITAEIRRFNRHAPIVRAAHRPAGFADLAGQPIDTPTGTRIGCFAGIARPETFARTLADVNLAPAETRWFPDHHVYTPADVDAIAAWADDAKLDNLITTEKDAVKLAHLQPDWPVPVATLRVAIEMLDDGDKIICDLIDAMLRDHEDEEEDMPDAQDARTE